MADSRFLDRLRDLSRQASHQGIIVSTRFLSPAEQTEATIWLKKNRTPHTFFGGLPDAERKVCFILPDDLDVPGFPADPQDVLPAEEIADTLTALRLSVQPRLGKEPPGHRDYLGSLLGLGIERDQMGDIIVDGQAATVLVLNRMAVFIQMNLTQVGSQSVQIEPVGLDEIKRGEQTVTTLRITVASLRLDKIVASGFNLSRTDAADIIRSGQVQLNWVVELRPDADVPIGATISLRGHGRIRLASEAGMSRKDRHILILEQYL